MEEWVLRAMQRWPNVPALFGWLGLDRRGRWLIRGEVISRPQIIETIDRNYAADEQGRWFFQNGPQRGYIELEYAPFVLRARGEALITHTQLPIASVSGAFLDEDGALAFMTPHGAGVLDDHDLDWALQRLTQAGGPIEERQLEQALAIPSGEPTALSIMIGGAPSTVTRLDRAYLPERLGFVRVPLPRESERGATRISD